LKDRLPRSAAVPSAILAFALLVGAPHPATGWLTAGHRQVAIDAVGLLSPEVPAFFRDGAALVGHVAVDPDVWKLRDLPELADREGPEHYLDWELIEGRELPPTRSAAARLMRELGREPSLVGFLPWAVVEGAERLAVCFAEHRRWPDDPAIRTKCLVYAGWLAHYAADLEQPLHTTLHHDGWALPTGDSPYVGIHRQIDALFEKARFDPARAVAGLAPARVGDLWAAVRGELATSHALVDATYALAPALAAPDGMEDARVVAFTCERYGTTARFLATLFAWAWERSGTLELPSWDQR
jgi:hypothetical protein